MTDAKQFKLEMERLKAAFEGGFWTGSEVQGAIRLLADTVAGFNDRLTAIEEKLTK